MSDEPKLRVPLGWVVVDVLGAILTGAGVLGLSGSGVRLLPILENRAVSAACVAAGLVLMAVALVQIVRRMRASAQRRRE